MKQAAHETKLMALSEETFSSPSRKQAEEGGRLGYDARGDSAKCAALVWQDGDRPRGLSFSATRARM